MSSPSRTLRAATTFIASKCSGGVATTWRNGWRGRPWRTAVGSGTGDNRLCRAILTIRQIVQRSVRQRYALRSAVSQAFPFHQIVRRQILGGT
jgi:hypothetical protein